MNWNSRHFYFNRIRYTTFSRLCQMPAAGGVVTFVYMALFSPTLSLDSAAAPCLNLTVAGCEKPMRLGAARGAIGRARLGDAEGGRRVGEARRIRQRHAFRQAHSQSRVKGVAGAGRIDHIDEKCGDHEAVIAGNDARSSRAQSHDCNLFRACQQVSRRRDHNPQLRRR